MSIMLVTVMACLMILGCLELRTKRNLGLVSFGIIFLFILMIATRNQELVPDTMAYRRFFELIPENYFEQGFRIYTTLMKVLCGQRVNLYFASFAIVNIILMYFVAKRLFGRERIYFCLFFSLYISYFGIMYNGIVLRAGLAISLSFLASTYVHEKKWGKVVVLLMLAVLFHKSAILNVITILVIKLDICFKPKTYKIISVFIWGGFVLSFTPHLRRLQESVIMMIVQQFPNVRYMHYLVEILEADPAFSFKFAFFAILSTVFAFCKNIEDRRYYNWLIIYDISMFIWMIFANTRISDIFGVWAVFLSYRYIISVKGWGKKCLIYIPVIICSLILVLRISKVV